MIRRPPRSTLFPSPTLFRSGLHEKARARVRAPPAGLSATPSRRTLLRPHMHSSESTMGARRAGSYHGPATTRKAGDRKSTRLNSSHLVISYAVFCLKKKKCYSSTFNGRHPNLAAFFTTAVLTKVSLSGRCATHASTYLYPARSPRCPRTSMHPPFFT